MRYVCQICGYVYDDEKEQVPFEQLPDSWKCPLCGASKSDFKPEHKERETAEVTVNTEAADMKKLSAGQLAAVCTNLARGCEKQYKPAEAELFNELAAYFTRITPAINDADAETLSRQLQEDIDSYPDVRAVADRNQDRGAARVCVWGEKVTRMLSSLVERYLKEGEQMLADTDIWVCTVCGFVYIGSNPPEACPVCKVPAYKFEKVEGRA
ncbi:MAG: rubredoxin [Lachnospiraceae bacterium]|nr:rubredoxin [Lachnospiraceae bacterium]